DELVDGLAHVTRPAGDVGRAVAVAVPGVDVEVLLAADLPAELERGAQPTAAEVVEGSLALKRIFVVCGAREPARELAVLEVHVRDRGQANAGVELPGKLGEPAVHTLVAVLAVASAKAGRVLDIHAEAPVGGPVRGAHREVAVAVALPEREQGGPL